MHEKEWKFISWTHSNEKRCAVCCALFGQMAVCRWGCVWQMSPGGRWSRVPGERGRLCVGRVPTGVWIGVGVLDAAGSGVACAQRDDAEQRYHRKWCLCGCDSFNLKLDSFYLYKRTGQWVVSFFTCREEQEIIRFCGPLHACLYWFSFRCFCVCFWGDFAYACPIYSDPERESILVLSICKQLMISEFGAEAHGSPRGHVFTGCLYSGERGSGTSSGFTWNK